jgi:hypothetical protein
LACGLHFIFHIDIDCQYCDIKDTDSATTAHIAPSTATAATAAMSGLVEKIKSHKPLSKGSKLPKHHLKENDPEKGTVNLSELPGTSASTIPSSITQRLISL